jgi:hypothetical protein
MKKFYSLFVVSAGRLVSVVALSVSTLYMNIAQAQGLQDLTVRNMNDRLFCPLFSALFDILIAISVIMVMYAAYTYVLAGDDAEKVTKARHIITYAAVAILVALIARGFPTLVSTVFPGTTVGWSC